jgi:hypothetical protein
MKSEIRWVAPTYPALHHVLTNPVYAGACASGKSRHQRYVDERGMLRGRTCHVPMAERYVLLPKHHPGFIDGADVSSQPSTHRHQHSSATSSSGSCRERRRCTATRPGHASKVWPPTAHSLSRHQLLTRLPLLREDYRPGTRRVLSQRRRRANRLGRGGGFLRAVTPAAVEATRLAIQAATS